MWVEYIIHVRSHVEHLYLMLYKPCRTRERFFSNLSKTSCDNYKSVFVPKVSVFAPDTINFKRISHRTGTDGYINQSLTGVNKKCMRL